jgi:hypothetical protein
MKDYEELNDLETKIRSLPEPDYDQKFTEETQKIIHENLLQFANSYEKKTKRSAVLMKKTPVYLLSVAALVLFAIFTIPIIKEILSSSDSNKPGQQIKEPTTIDKEVNNQNEVDTILYNNTEYGFTFTLPKGWESYQIISDSWEGISNDDTNQVIENGTILLIRHPEWTQEKQRQDIPIMIFTHAQWSALEREEFHIGAAPIGPTKLGENNEYVFALPARYNFAFPEGYEEVETILQNNPLQPNNIEKDPLKMINEPKDRIKKLLIPRRV